MPRRRSVIGRFRFVARFIRGRAEELEALAASTSGASSLCSAGAPSPPPKDLPPKSIAWADFDLCGPGMVRCSASITRFYVTVREQAGQAAIPTTAIIDSQTSRARKKGGLA